MPPSVDAAVDVGFVSVPNPPGNDVLPSLDDAADDDAEKLKSGADCVAGALVLAALGLKKPGLAYAAELSNDDGGDNDGIVVPIPVSHDTNKLQPFIHTIGEPVPEKKYL